MVPVITSSDPNSFSWTVLQNWPALIDHFRYATPYPPSVQRALDALLEEIEGPIEPLGDAFWDRYAGQNWYDVPFLWAEGLFYRKLLIALDYFELGPWQGIDPFAPEKDPQLDAADLPDLDDLADMEPQDRDRTLLDASVWGNQADLRFAMQMGERGDRVPALIADDSAVLWDLLSDGGKVCLVADNAGPELLPDLELVDNLLSTGRASSVSLHLKAYPYYVSDATVADAIAAIAWLNTRISPRARRRGPHPALRTEDESPGVRLRQHVVQGTLVLAAHPFSCAPLPYAEMPPDLRDEFRSATVTIMKGDLNYRRLVEDRMWPPTTPFDEVTAYFPGPVAALRTLKSEVVTGLSPETVEALEASGQVWRTSGTRALIQVRR